MGVSGVGKTAVGQALAERLGLECADADDLHPPANVEKMRGGTPLTDEDRLPWLRRLGRLAVGGRRSPPTAASSPVRVSGTRVRRT